MRRARLWLIVPIAGFAAAVGCSLGLDPSLIGAAPGQDASVANDGAMMTMGDALPTDAPTSDRAVSPTPDGGQCAKDDDCKVANNMCVSAAHCDPNLFVCVLDVCNVGACKAAVCDTSSMTCTVPTSVAYHAGAFGVPSGATGCSGSPGCFAVVYPYVFVGTNSGVLAYQVSDPTNFAPPEIPVSGVTFPPGRIVSVGRRVYFIGSPFGGTGNDVRINVASLDVPGTPFLTTLVATSVTVQTPTLTGGEQIFPGDKASVFLINADSGRSFPAGVISAPLTDNATIAQFPSSGVPAGVNIVASSGPRLITYRFDGGAFVANFSFENGVATTNAQNSGESAAASMGNVYPQTNFFAQGTDGSVLWMAPQGDTPMDGGPMTTNSARMAWLVSSAASTSFDATQHVDVETYSGLGGFASVGGPIAWIDPNTALVLAADPGNMSQTSVQVASRSGGPPVIVNSGADGGPPKRFVVSADVNHVVAAADGGFGYVLHPDTSNPNDAFVEIFAPGCD